MGQDEAVLIDESMSRLFSVETHDQLERLIAILLRLEADPSEQDAVINEMFRIVHNIKGSSGMMGLTDLKELMHTVESIFDGVRKGRVRLGVAEADLLLDISRQVMAYVESGNWSDTGLFADWKSAVQDAFLPRTCSPEPGETLLVLSEQEETEITAWQEAGNAVYGIEAAFSPDAVMPGATALIFTKFLEKFGTVLKTAPEIKALGEEKPGIFKVVLRVERTLTPEQEGEIASYTGHNDMTVRLRKWTYRPKQPAPLAKPEHIPVDNTIRVEPVKIDRLINNVQELLAANAGLRRLYEGGYQGIGTWNQLGKTVRLLEQVADQLRFDATSLRMVPVRQLFCRFPVIVRDVAKKRGKTAEIRFFGEETEIDKHLAEQLVNPLTHIIRNAVDHGLEDGEERRAAGKPPTGQVTLGACQEGDRVVISVSDDGRGLNPDKIRAKALKNGLIKENDPLTKDDLLRLIFQPGFSTADQVTDISGRGVGLDVVQEAINALKGEIEVATETGKGTTFRLKVPLTLAIIQTFMIRVGGQTFGIALDDILGSLLVGAEELRHRESKMFFPLPEEEIPVVDLADMLGLESTGRAKKIPLIIIKISGRTAGLLADELIGQDKVILKQINQALENNPLISGAAFLSNGDMSLILNTQRIVRQAVG